VPSPLAYLFSCDAMGMCSSIDRRAICVVGQRVVDLVLILCWSCVVCLRLWTVPSSQLGSDMFEHGNRELVSPWP
jgi:hypothetical protein